MTKAKKVERVLPAADPLSKQTEFGATIQIVDDAVRRVDGWIASHLPDTADEVREHLIQARAALGKEIGLDTTKEGHLVDPETVAKADSAINPDGSAKKTANKPQSGEHSPAPFDATNNKNEDLNDDGSLKGQKEGDAGNPADSRS